MSELFLSDGVKHQSNKNHTSHGTAKPAVVYYKSLHKWHAAKLHCIQSSVIHCGIWETRNSSEIHMCVELGH